MKYEYIGDQQTTIHGNGEAGDRMSEEEFAAALRELRGEYTAPSEVAEVCARLFEELWAENKRLREEVAHRHPPVY